MVRNFLRVLVAALLTVGVLHAQTSVFVPSSGGGASFSSCGTLIALLGTDYTGSCGKVVLDTSPSLVTPTLGAASFTSLTGSGATVVASTPLFDLSQTWNNAGVPFTGLKLNVTNTNSATGSLMVDTQIGGTSVFNVTRRGVLSVANPGGNSAQLDGLNGTITAYPFISLGQVYNGARIRAADSYQWAPSTDATTAADLFLSRDAANILAQRNGTNAQEFRLYSTFTDTSNYSRLTFKTSSTDRWQIVGERAGTGEYRNLDFLFGGTTTYGFRVPSDATQPIEIGTQGTGSANVGRARIGGTNSATSGTTTDLELASSIATVSTSTQVHRGVYIHPTYNMSNGTPGAGSYEALKIAAVETAIWSGTNYLIRASAGAAGTTDKFTVKNDGTVAIAGLTTTGAAGTKKVVCVDTATGQLYASSTTTDCSN